MKRESINQLETDYYNFLLKKGISVKRINFKDSNPDGLAKCIKSWLHMNGHYATSEKYWITFSVTSRFIRNRHRTHPCDLIAIIGNKTVCIDCRHNECSQEIKQEIEDKGAFYMEAVTFDNFLHQIKNLI